MKKSTFTFSMAVALLAIAGTADAQTRTRGTATGETKTEAVTQTRTRNTTEQTTTQRAATTTDRTRTASDNRNANAAAEPRKAATTTTNTEKKQTVDTSRNNAGARQNADTRNNQAKQTTADTRKTETRQTGNDNVRTVTDATPVAVGNSSRAAAITESREQIREREEAEARAKDKARYDAKARAESEARRDNYYDAPKPGPGYRPDRDPWYYNRGPQGRGFDGRRYDDRWFGVYRDDVEYMNYMSAAAVEYRRLTFDSNRMKLARIRFETGRFYTAYEVARIAETFTFDSNRYEFLREAYRYTMDNWNYYVAVRTLTFSSNRTKLYNYMAEMADYRYRYNILGDVVGTTARELEEIVMALRDENNSGKLRLAKAVAATNLLTAEQAAVIAYELAYDSDRLEFLTFAYEFTDDRADWWRAADAFRYNSYRDKFFDWLARVR